MERTATVDIGPCFCKIHLLTFVRNAILSVELTFPGRYAKPQKIEDLHCFSENEEFAGEIVAS